MLSVVTPFRVRIRLRRFRIRLRRTLRLPPRILPLRSRRLLGIRSLLLHTRCLLRLRTRRPRIRRILRLHLIFLPLLLHRSLLLLVFVVGIRYAT